MIERKIRALFLCVLLSLSCVSWIACAQQTEAPISQPSDQAVSPPTSTDQDAATQGSQVYTYIINAPARGEVPDPGGNVARLLEGDGKSLDTLASNGVTLKGTDAGYVQAGIHLTINTGSTTPSLSGTTTATTSGTQTPTANPTVSPTQDVRPRVGIALPIAVAPGGIIDQAVSANAGEGSSPVDKTSTNELRRAEIRALADAFLKNPDLLGLLFQFLGIESPTTQPATLEE